MPPQPLPTAIIGAGIAGLAAARALARQGLPVVLIDKGRRVGGRLAARAKAGFAFDHGAQYFTARDPDFVLAVQGWQAAGAVVPLDGPIIHWDGRAARPVERYVATPDMNALARHLGRGLTVHAGCRATRLLREGDYWQVAVETADGGSGMLGPFAAVLVTVPAPQAEALMRPLAPALAEAASRAYYSPCWTLMAGLSAPHRLPFQGAHIDRGPIAWIGAREPSALVIQASPAWSEAALESPPDEVAPLLWSALAALIDRDLGTPALLLAHRWRFAKVEMTSPEAAYWDAGLGLGLAGDWCLGGRVEAAWCSGVRLAAAVLDAPARLQ